MTKKEIHQSINKAFYEWVTKTYPEYELDDCEGYGRIYLNDKNGHQIEYHQSRHDFCSYDEDKTTMIKIGVMETKIHELKQQYGLQ